MMIIGCILLLQVQHSWANSVLVLLLLNFIRKGSSSLLGVRDGLVLANPVSFSQIHHQVWDFWNKLQLWMRALHKACAGRPKEKGV